MESLTRTCERCGLSFDIPSLRSWAAKYCSQSCQGKAKSARQNIRRRGELTPRTCRGCYASFEPTNTVNFWCSDACRRGVTTKRRSAMQQKVREAGQCRHCKGPIENARTRNAVYCRSCANPRARRVPKNCQCCGVELEGRKRTWCSECQAATKYARGRAAVYGISYQEYLDVVGRGACDICGTPLVERMSDSVDYREVGHIDHDHVTGNVRGYLCRMCNHMIGNGKDNPELLEAGATYLRVIGGWDG